MAALIQRDPVGGFLGTLFIGLALLAGGIALSLPTTLRTLASLRQSCVRELDQLKSTFSARHLIFVHLFDSLPDRLDGEARVLNSKKTHIEAKQALESIDPSEPAAEAIWRSARLELELFHASDDLAKRIEADDSLSSDQPINGCLSGLEDANRDIKDAISAYNASAITYANCLERPVTSVVSRFLPKYEFELFDLNLYSSEESAT